MLSMQLCIESGTLSLRKRAHKGNVIVLTPLNERELLEERMKRVFLSSAFVPGTGWGRDRIGVIIKF